MSNAAAVTSDFIKLGEPTAGLLSERTQAALDSGSSWTRRMFNAAGELRAQGRPVFDLSLGNPDAEPPAPWREAVIALLREASPGQHRYMNSRGLPDVRKFIAVHEGARYGVRFAADDVTMTVGAA